MNRFEMVDLQEIKLFLGIRILRNGNFRLFNKALICWNSKKQNSVAASSTEAEYMALFEGVKEAMFFKQLAESIGIKIDRPIPIFEDNQGCIQIANNPTCNKRSKHIDIKYHFSRDRICAGDITLCFIPTEHQEADIFTKNLSGPTFVKLRMQLGLEQHTKKQ